MANSPFVFHFETFKVKPDCFELNRNIMNYIIRVTKDDDPDNSDASDIAAADAADAVAEVNAALDAAADADDAAAVAEESDNADEDSKHVLQNMKLWADVAQLQWGLISDRVVDNTIKQKGEELSKIRRSMRTLIEAYKEVFPNLAGEDLSTLAQVIALGSEMSTEAGNSPDLMDFIKTELQPVDLALMLKL